MSRTPQKNYLRTYRRGAGLSLGELAALLGVHTSTLERYEAGVRRMPADVVRAAEIVFGMNAARIFPALYNTVEEELPIRALTLHDHLQGRTDEGSLKKLALIRGIPNRLG